MTANRPANAPAFDSLSCKSSQLNGAVERAQRTHTKEFCHRIYSGIGGQKDFIRGAALSRGGKPILALPSTAAGGRVSRIVPELTPGAGVVTTRGHVHWVV